MVSVWTVQNLVLGLVLKTHVLHKELQEFIYLTNRRNLFPNFRFQTKTLSQGKKLCDFDLHNVDGSAA